MCQEAAVGGVLSAERNARDDARSDAADDARAAYDSAVPVIDRMANRGIIKKNKAARHKSRLNARVKAMAS